MFNYKKIVKRIISEVTQENMLKYGLKYYAFDWDDNLMEMPTLIYLKDEDGDVIGMSTEDFAEYRTLVGQEPFNYKGHMIVGFDKDPYRDFGVSGDRKFLEDIKYAPIASQDVWNDFKEAINYGSVFAIITARGHTPSVLKRAVKYLIENNMHGIEKSQLIKNLKEYRRRAGLKQVENENWLINDYLERCQFSPVSYRAGSAANPEEAKIREIKRFMTNQRRSSKKFQKSYFINHVSSGDDSVGGNLFKFVEPKFGFSDDDERNVHSMKNKLSDKEKENLNIYLTKGGEKNIYENWSSRRLVQNKRK
jgi:hypothetical protein